jgi:hypothetical protein
MPFFPTLAVSLVLVLIRRLLSVLAFHSVWIGD